MIKHLLIVTLLAVTPTQASKLKPKCSKYERKMYGTTPSQKIRQAVIRDAKNKDYYTGLQLVSKPDIDHVVSLKTAWPIMCKKPYKTRNMFANDITNLVATTPTINRGKGSLTPGTWLPANREKACAYVTKYVMVVKKWNLKTVVTDADRYVFRTVCPSGPIQY